jgi:hypothetical protein
MRSCFYISDKGIREDECNTNDDIDVCFVFAKETNEIACANLAGMNPLATFFKCR